ncbi:hypothetical protein Ahy_B02g059673 isoform D [Arachis hypogaea]|uniref:Uncharacterized protein n=1 Tax=Arachis hypogaea TaxID=3818 RepID=A0A445AH31_ARAHY|nr:hypothetical protein Ahy_B02g059673 isoform D [Arachis hypogaea]
MSIVIGIVLLLKKNLF